MPRATRSTSSTASRRRAPGGKRAGGLGRLASRLPRIVTVHGPLADVAVDGHPPDALAVAIAAPTDRPDGSSAVQLSPGAAALGSALDVDLDAYLGYVHAHGAAGEVHALPVAVDGRGIVTLYLVGVGDAGPRALRQAGASLVRQARARSVLAVEVEADDEGRRAFVEGLMLGSYRFSRKGHTAGPDETSGRQKPKDPPSLATIAVLSPHDAAPSIERGVLAARATERARDLANTPSNEKDPAWLAARAEELAQEAGLAVRIRDERELAEGGFGGLLAVGSGSSRPPRLIELRYEPRRGGTDTPHIVLVGKGITFDSGGLSLKPREAMVPMKTDMAAGGAVLATLAALPELDIPVRVTGLVAAAENMPGGAAMRPGDVIRHYGGRTVEVLNTDAEGRLVLADALAYADDELDPDVLIDLATLTGAASIGLGRQHAALFTADDALAGELIDAGERSGERLWRMPLVEDYRPAMDSPVADLANVARDRSVSGGAITAALFLREFAGRRRWAHLDIAGPARAGGDDHWISKGGTGFGARLLLRWLEETARASRRP